jgi:hypothetical protein
MGGARRRPSRAAAAVLTALVVSACARDDAGGSRRTPPSDTSLAGLSAAARRGDLAARRALARAGHTTRVQPLAPSDSGPLGAHRPADLDDAARRIIAFLRGEVPFDRIRVADTVTFHVRPDGVEARTTTLGRRQLRDRSNWKVNALGAAASLVPHRDLTRLTTRVGGHLNCFEYRLSSRFPDLARLPHVGTRLDPGEGASCLQTHNATFVFDPNAKPPTLVAVVYDQFEW